MPPPKPTWSTTTSRNTTTTTSTTTTEDPFDDHFHLDSLASYTFPNQQQSNNETNVHFTPHSINVNTISTTTTTTTTTTQSSLSTNSGLTEKKPSTTQNPFLDPCVSNSSSTPITRNSSKRVNFPQPFNSSISPSYTNPFLAPEEYHSSSSLQQQQQHSLVQKTSQPSTSSTSSSSPFQSSPSPRFSHALGSPSSLLGPPPSFAPPPLPTPSSSSTPPPSFLPNSSSSMRKNSAPPTSHSLPSHPSSSSYSSSLTSTSSSLSFAPSLHPTQLHSPSSSSSHNSSSIPKNSVASLSTLQSIPKISSTTSTPRSNSSPSIFSIPALPILPPPPRLPLPSQASLVSSPSHALPPAVPPRPSPFLSDLPFTASPPLLPKRPSQLSPSPMTLPTTTSSSSSSFSSNTSTTSTHSLSLNSLDPFSSLSTLSLSLPSSSFSSSTPSKNHNHSSPPSSPTLFTTTTSSSSSSSLSSLPPITPLHWTLDICNRSVPIQFNTTPIYLPSKFSSTSIKTMLLKSPYFVTGHKDLTRIFHVVSGQLLMTLLHHEKKVTALQFVPTYQLHHQTRYLWIGFHTGEILSVDLEASSSSTSSSSEPVSSSSMDSMMVVPGVSGHRHGNHPCIPKVLEHRLFRAQKAGSGSSLSSSSSSHSVSSSSSSSSSSSGNATNSDLPTNTTVSSPIHHLFVYQSQVWVCMEDIVYIFQQTMETPYMTLSTPPVMTFRVPWSPSTSSSSSNVMPSGIQAPVMTVTEWTQGQPLLCLASAQGFLFGYTPWDPNQLLQFKLPFPSFSALTFRSLSSSSSSSSSSSFIASCTHVTFIPGTPWCVSLHHDMLCIWDLNIEKKKCHHIFQSMSGPFLHVQGTLEGTIWAITSASLYVFEYQSSHWCWVKKTEPGRTSYSCSLNTSTPTHATNSISTTTTTTTTTSSGSSSSNSSGSSMKMNTTTVSEGKLGPSFYIQTTSMLPTTFSSSSSSSALSSSVFAFAPLQTIALQITYPNDDIAILFLDGDRWCDWLAHRLSEKESQYSESSTLTVRLCSWNVDASNPSDIEKYGSMVANPTTDTEPLFHEHPRSLPPLPSSVSSSSSSSLSFFGDPLKQLKDWFTFPCSTSSSTTSSTSLKLMQPSNPMVYAPPDIIVIGLQEIVDLENKPTQARHFIFGAHSFRKKKKKSSTSQSSSSSSFDTSNSSFFKEDKISQQWQSQLLQAIRQAYPCSYRTLVTHSMVGLFVMVLIKTELAEHVAHTQVQELKTGFKGLHGNKGGVCVRFSYHATSFCFCVVHLAAGQDEVLHRHRDAYKILDETQFSIPSLTPSTSPSTSLTSLLCQLHATPFRDGSLGQHICEHHHVFFLGDLNYRLDWDRGSLESTLTSFSKTNAPFWEPVWAKDQLIKSRKQRQGILSVFQEPPLKFLPTYKYDVGMHQWDSSEKQRSPAWCDRILYWSGPSTFQLDSHGFQLDSPALYYHRMENVMSDHRPIVAMYPCKVKKNLTSSSSFGFHSTWTSFLQKEAHQRGVERWLKSIQLQWSSFPVLLTSFTQDIQHALLGCPSIETLESITAQYWQALMKQSIVEHDLVQSKT